MHVCVCVCVLIEYFFSCSWHLTVNNNNNNNRKTSIPMILLEIFLAFVIIDILSNLSDFSSNLRNDFNQKTNKITNEK